MDRKKVKKLRREYTVVLREKLLQMYEGNARENEFLVQGSSYRELTVHVQCICIPLHSAIYLPLEWNSYMYIFMGNTIQALL